MLFDAWIVMHSPEAGKQKESRSYGGCLQMTDGHQPRRTVVRLVTILVLIIVAMLGHQAGTLYGADRPMYRGRPATAVTRAALSAAPPREPVWIWAGRRSAVHVFAA